MNATGYRCAWGRQCMTGIISHTPMTIMMISADRRVGPDHGQVATASSGSSIRSVSDAHLAAAAHRAAAAHNTAASAVSRAGRETALGARAAAHDGTAAHVAGRVTQIARNGRRARHVPAHQLATVTSKWSHHRRRQSERGPTSSTRPVNSR